MIVRAMALLLLLSAPAAAGGGLFGGAPTPHSPPPFSPPGAPTPARSGATPAFGAGATPPPAPSGGLFGGAPPAPSAGLFGGTPPPSPSGGLFGGAAAFVPASGATPAQATADRRGYRAAAAERRVTVFGFAPRASSGGLVSGGLVPPAPTHAVEFVRFRTTGTRLPSCAELQIAQLKKPHATMFLQRRARGWALGHHSVQYDVEMCPRGCMCDVDADMGRAGRAEIAMAGYTVNCVRDARAKSRKSGVSETAVCTTTKVNIIVASPYEFYVSPILALSFNISARLEGSRLIPSASTRTRGATARALALLTPQLRRPPARPSAPPFAPFSPFSVVDESRSFP
jgi:hypothetical protein